MSEIRKQEREAQERLEQTIKMGEALSKIPAERREMVVAHLQGICEGMRIENELRKKETA